MSAAYISSLIEKTNPEPYEQIIVLCQKMINEAFNNMWMLADDDSPLSHFKYSNRAGEYINTDLGPPKVQLVVTTEDPQLYYLLAMRKGSLKIYTTDNPDDPADIEWAIDGWVFAFSVKIGKPSCRLAGDFHVSAILADNPALHEPQVERRFRKTPQSTQNIKSVQDCPNPTSHSLNYLLTPHVSVSIKKKI